MRADASYRVSLPVRVFCVGWALFWLGACGAGVVKAAGKGAWLTVVVAALVGLVGGTVAWRNAQLALFTDGDELVIRNVYRTRRLRRADVEGFRVGTPSMWPFGEAIHVLARGGTVIASDATSSACSRRARRRRDTTLERLGVWLHDA